MKDNYPETSKNKKITFSKWEKNSSIVKVDSKFLAAILLIDFFIAARYFLDDFLS